MIKTLVGEAVGQPGDTDQYVILSTAANRFDDPAFPGKPGSEFPGTPRTWQAVLSPDFYGAANGTTNGPARELRNAAQAYTGQIGDIVGGAKCLWSPDNAEWAIILAALNSGTKKFPTVTRAPDCWASLPRQIIRKVSVGLNVSGGPNFSEAPAFVFMRLRSQNAPAVVQIP
jgi:hypothetical protein